MKGFILGILVTLAVLYPTVTKNLLAKAVDVTNGVVTGVLERIHGQLRFRIKSSNFGLPNITIMVDIRTDFKYNCYCSE